MIVLYRVMARMETNEECCFKNDLSEEQAWKWLEDNRHQYPECRFFIEPQESLADLMETSGDYGDCYEP